MHNQPPGRLRGVQSTRALARSVVTLYDRLLPLGERPTQFRQGDILQLPDPLSGHSEVLSHFFESFRFAAVQPEIVFVNKGRFFVSRDFNQAKTKYAVCLDGRNACPPEDCGGIWGYYRFLEAVAITGLQKTFRERNSQRHIVLKRCLGPRL